MSHYDSLGALSSLPPATPAPTTPTSHYDSLEALSPPPPATPAPTTPNKSLRLVGGSLSPFACDTSSNNAQRVIMTRWRHSPPLPLRRQLQRPPTSHYDSLEAPSPTPPATPATSTPNESLRLVGGSCTPSTCNASHTDPSACDASDRPPSALHHHQRVAVTRWGFSLPPSALHPHQRVVVTRWLVLSRIVHTHTVVKLFSI